MNYRLLDNQTGVLSNRKPILVEKNLVLSFPQAIDKMTVAIENQGVQYFRELQSRRCSIDVAALQGEIKVTLLDTTPGRLQKKWVCEGLFAEHTKNGVWVYPNDGNLPQIVAQLRVENDNMRQDFAALEKKFKGLEERFERMMEGYDVT